MDIVARNKLYDIVRHETGVQKVQQKLVEELAELQAECSKMQLKVLDGEMVSPEDVGRIMGEMADVLICIEQNTFSEKCLPDLLKELWYTQKLERLHKTAMHGDLLKGMAWRT